MKRLFSWFKRIFGPFKFDSISSSEKPRCLRCGRELYGRHFFYCTHCYDILARNHY